jgi:putative DNA primase/helicase
VPVPPADAGGPTPDTGRPESAGTWTNGAADAELSAGAGSANDADRAELADTQGEGGNPMAAGAAARPDHGAGRDTLPPHMVQSLVKQAGIALAEGDGAPTVPLGLSYHSGIPVYVDELRGGAWGAVYRTRNGRTGFCRSVGKPTFDERQMLLDKLPVTEGLARAPKANGYAANGRAVEAPVEAGGDESERKVESEHQAEADKGPLENEELEVGEEEHPKDAEAEGGEADDGGETKPEAAPQAEAPKGRRGKFRRSTADPGDVELRFREDMERHGIRTEDRIVADGKLHRFHVEDDDKARRNGWYVLHLDARPAGVFGCHKRQIKETWKADGPPLTDQERAQFRVLIEESRKSWEREIERERQRVAKVCKELLDLYAEASEDHPYLNKKGIKPHGVLVDSGGKLVVPVLDAKGRVSSLQTIAAEGEKRFHPGGRVQGCSYTIGEHEEDIGEVESDRRVVVCEGFATGASIHEATGIPTVVAFNAGNLEAVAKVTRKRHPKARIAVAADNDCEMKEPIENPGVHFARKAAKAVGAEVAVPVRREPDGKSSTSTNCARRKAQRPSPGSSWRPSTGRRRPTRRRDMAPLRSKGRTATAGLTSCTATAAARRATSSTTSASSCAPTSGSPAASATTP